MRRGILQYLSVCIAVYAACQVLSVSAQTPSPPPLKQLVFDDCEAAKGILGSSQLQADPAFVQYLIDVLHLKLSAELQPVPLPQVVTKWQDPSVARLDAAQLVPPGIGPLGVMDSSTERAARRCAVQLLGMMGSSAAPSIPELVRYASQNELDDAARAEAEAVVFRIAAASGTALPAKALLELVQDFSINREELVRSVLLIIAPTRILHIASLLLSDAAVPEQSVARIFQDLFWGDPDSARSVFQDHLTHGEYNTRRRAMRVLVELDWTLEALGPLFDTALLSSVPATVSISPDGADPTLAEITAQLIVRGDWPCSRVAPPLLEGMMASLSRDGIVGDAAIVRLRCAIANGQILSESLQRLVGSSDVLVRRRLVALALATQTQSGAQIVRALAQDPDSSVRLALLEGISKIDAKAPEGLRSVLLALMQSLEARPATQEQRNELFQGLAQIARFGVGAQRGAWEALMPRLLSRVAMMQSGAMASAQELEVLKTVLQSLGKTARGYVGRLIASGNSSERLLGAQLLAPISQGRTASVEPLLRLLGDADPQVRKYALSVLSHTLEGGRVGLKAPRAPLNTTAQGALQVLTMLEGKTQTAPSRSAATWLESSSCEEFLMVLSEPILNADLTWVVVERRLMPCLKVVRALPPKTAAALHGKSAITQEIIKGILERSIDAALIPVVLSQAERWQLPPRQILSLLDTGLSQLPIQEAQSLLGYASTGGLPEREAIKAMEDFAQRAGLRSPEGCRALWVASELSGDTYNWKGRFRAEAASDDEQFFTCAAYGRAEVARRALIELLADAPSRKQAALLRRITELKELSRDQELEDVVKRAAESPNEEIRCQGARLALRIDPTSSVAISAVRHAMYGGCWDELRADAARHPMQGVAREILKTAQNYLEQLRAQQLENFSAPTGSPAG